MDGKISNSGECGALWSCLLWGCKFYAVSIPGLNGHRKPLPEHSACQHPHHTHTHNKSPHTTAQPALLRQCTVPVIWGSPILNEECHARSSLQPWASAMAGPKTLLFPLLQRNTQGPSDRVKGMKRLSSGNQTVVTGRHQGILSLSMHTQGWALT